MTYLVDTDYTADYLKGIYYGQNRAQHEQGFRQLVKAIPVVSITRSVALHFAPIRGDLRAKGLLIPDPDLYIAATALLHKLTLITRNVKDYERIPHLKLYQ